MRPGICRFTMNVLVALSQVYVAYAVNFEDENENENEDEQDFKGIQ